MVEPGNTQEDVAESGEGVLGGYAGGVLGGTGGGQGRGGGAGGEGDGRGGRTGRPRLRDAPRPAYPAELVRSGIEGRVVVRVRVEPSGRPSEVAVVRSLHPVLDARAREAVLRWRWEPARERGRAVAADTTIAVVFRIDDRRSR